MSEYSTIPKGAKSQPKPFKAEIPESAIEELKTLLKYSKIGPKTYENLQDNGRFGVKHSWLTDAKAKWEQYDWRKEEAKINSFPNYTYAIEGMTIHFAALFSEKSDAIPLILMHGWPGSFLEFLPMLELAKKKWKPADMPYHFIIPSLPGYTYSSGPPLDKDFTPQDVARIMHLLMTELGFGDGYIAQGGDIGSRVARWMGTEYEGCKGVHLNFCAMPMPEALSRDDHSEEEKNGIERGEEFITVGSAYAQEHATRPATIGFVLASNPIALLSWIGEKFLIWVDEPLPLDTILADATLYWITETFPRAIYPYRHRIPLPKLPADCPDYKSFGRTGLGHGSKQLYLNKPLGFSYFPKELIPTPEKWVRTTGQLVSYKMHDRGGHFAALEQPESLLGDVEEFIGKAWKQ